MARTAKASATPDIIEPSVSAAREAKYHPKLLVRSGPKASAQVIALS
ncbi:MAG: hypothetical protein AVDCRST_MAG29-2250 [uncultured Nocardioidaceae bacterium]|uniref:Uncharacterized protein n=1 Tax=uncultured Nocardioidaceae bacterium TaxID=253824 RepID=A0A6J4M6B2_9ACTN|nr:MAG: hypothetical protein AVDCRST_MAG29-2250 [uncultured Nocardioidaceae bacterium]